MAKRITVRNILGGSEVFRVLDEKERSELKVYDNGIRDQKGTAIREREVKTALKFLALCQPAKGTPRHSYGLKHEMEDWGARNNLESYVSNGAAIEAVRRLGWPIAIAEREDDPNAMLGVRRARRTRRFVS